MISSKSSFNKYGLDLAPVCRACVQRFAACRICMHNGHLSHANFAVPTMRLKYPCIVVISLPMGSWRKKNMHACTHTRTHACMHAFLHACIICLHTCKLCMHAYYASMHMTHACILCLHARTHARMHTVHTHACGHNKTIDPLAKPATKTRDPTP